MMATLSPQRALHWGESEDLIKVRVRIGIQEAWLPGQSKLLTCCMMMSHTISPSRLLIFPLSYKGIVKIRYL